MMQHFSVVSLVACTQFEKESRAALYFANILRVYVGGLLEGVAPGEGVAPRVGLP